MPKIVVIDSNIVIKWLSKKNEEGVLAARKIYELMVSGEVEVFAPEFLLVEVLNILIKKKKISNSIIRRLMKTLVESEIEFKRFDKNEINSLENIVFKYGITSYDAMYILLAKTLDCHLLTMDEGLLAIKEFSVDLEKLLSEFKEYQTN